MGIFSLNKGKKKNESVSTSIFDKFFTEFGEESLNTDNYTSSGVNLDYKGDDLRLRYSGLLANSGANGVYAAVSYGDSKAWNDVKYYKMDSVGDKTFEAVIPSTGGATLNVAFKDDANNWDNNSGANYSFYA